MKSFFGVIAVVIGIVALGFIGRFIGIGLGIITLPVNKLESQVKLNQGVIKKTYDTEYCLANYEWFKDTDQDIIQMVGQISNKEEQLKSFQESAGARTNWTFEDKQQYNTLTNELTGMKNYRLDLVAQYNSKTEQLNRVACKDMPLFVKP